MSFRDFWNFENVISCKLYSMLDVVFVFHHLGDLGHHVL